MKFPGCDASTEVRDAGVGVTTVTTYGTAQRHVPMPVIEDGMSGVARLYHRTFVFDASFPAWNGETTNLTGGGLIKPNMDAANLQDGGEAVQPRPGTMPGLYLLQSEGETQEFLHYGGPVDSGANPQTTAVYQLAEGGGGGGMFQPAFLVTATTTKYTNNLSGAELWHYTGITQPYVEIKHVDGSVARFDSFNPWTSSYATGAGANLKLWRVTQVRDPYDNVATYSYSANHRLTQIAFPSGLTQKFHYGPSWSNWGSTNCLEVTYEQGATALPDRAWGLVFSGTMGTNGGSHFGKRLHRTYSARRNVLPDPTTGQPHAITSGYAVLGQIVNLFTYNTTSRVLTESQAVHTGTSFDASLTTPSGLGTVDVLVTTYVASGTNAGRVSAQALQLTGDAMTIAYPSSGFRTTDLLSGTVMAGIEVTDAAGTLRRFEYDNPTGRLYSVLTTPPSNFGGKPRSLHAASENSGIGGVATTDVEPESITIYNLFSAACSCYKPVEVRHIARRNGTDFTRVTKYEYFAGTKLLKKRSEPNPQAGSGTFPAEVHWNYTYQQAKGSGQLWGAWLPLQESTPDGTWDYSYGDWLDRSDATNHGRIAGSVQRTISGVRQQSSLSGAPTTPTTDVTETLLRNLSNSPGGLAAMGNVRGQPRRILDGDGVSTTFEYSTEGWLTAEDALGGATRTTFGHNSYGEVTSLTENAGSTAHQATTTLVMMSGPGVPSSSSSTSGGLLRASETYFDRWGHAAVQRQNNLASDPSAPQPSKHLGSGANARPWIETQHHYQHRRLMEVYRDRKPLDDAAGTGQFLVTQLVYSSVGRLAHQVNPKGSTTQFDFDGYGTLYRTQTKDPTGAITVKGPKSFMNPFLEVTGSYEFDGSNHLWTTIARNSAGAITQITEPSTAAPSGYTPYAGGNFSTGGARHEFELDELGRVTKTQTFEGTLLLAMREMRHDQLGRQIWQHDEARTRKIDGTTATVVGQHYVAWKYAAGKASWLDTVERSGIAPVTYEYWSSGLLKRVRDGFFTGNTVEYSYAGGTPFVSSVVKTDLDPVTSSRVTTTAFDLDPFGRTTAIREGSPQLVHSYAYNSLGQVDRYTDPAGRVQKFLPDAMGRIVEHVRVGDSPDYIRNSTVFEDSGFADGRTKVRRWDGQSHETITHSDFAGRPFLVQNPGGSVAPTPSAKNQAMCLYAEYDEASRVTAVFDGEGETRFRRDGAGRVILRELASLISGHKVALWNTTDWFRRDATGRILENDYLGLGLLWGEQRVETDSLGRTHNENFQFAFAPGNSIDVASTFSGGNPYRSGLGYDDNLTGTGASGFAAPMNLAYTHDVIGRLTEVQWDRAPGGGTAMHVLAEYGWAGSLRRTRNVRYGSTAYPQGRSLFSYDVYNRLTQIQDDVWTTSSAFTTKSKFDYHYDAASNLVKEEYLKVGGGVGDRFAYDAYHRLKTAWMGVDAATMAATANPTGFNASQMHAQLTYQLDTANNRTRVTEQTSATLDATLYSLEGSGTGPSISNRYETVGPLGSAVLLDYDERGNLTYDGNFAYRYDYMNRLQEVWTVVPQGDGLMAQEGEKFALIEPEAVEEVREDVKDDVPDLMQRLVREHKDPVFRARLRKALRGGVLRVQPTQQGGGGRPGFFPEPALLQLVAVYLYDGYNRRTTSFVIGEETHLHVWDGWQQVQELDWVEHATGSGSFWAKPMKQFVWGSRLDELVSYRRLNGTAWETYYVLHGGQDTAAKLVDVNGNIVEQYEYDPYGKVSVYTGSSTTPADVSAYGLPFLWKGVRLDAETGLLYMRNRYYSNEMGRFLSNDPLGAWFDAGNAGNGYAYAWSNPIAVSDPLGLFPPAIIAWLAALGGGATAGEVAGAGILAVGLVGTTVKAAELVRGLPMPGPSPSHGPNIGSEEFWKHIAGGRPGPTTGGPSGPSAPAPSGPSTGGGGGPGGGGGGGGPPVVPILTQLKPMLPLLIPMPFLSPLCADGDGDGRQSCQLVREMPDACWYKCEDGRIAVVDKGRMGCADVITLPK